MDLMAFVKNFFSRNEAPVAEADPFDVQGNVRAAYALLADANKKAIQIPAEVVDVITQARRAGAQLPDDLEAKFWNAYGLLSSSIQPAAKARNLYRNIFYVVLLVLLFAQFFFLAGDYVRGKLAEVDKQVIDIRGRAAAPSNAVASATPVDAATAQIEQVERTKKAYLFLTHNLLAIVGTIADLPLRPFGIQSFFSESGASDPEGVIIRGKLDMLLVFLSGYLLPMLYGLLGACAFVLRKLSDEIDKLTYANDARVRYSLRLNIGLLSGLAVGWFIKPGAGDATLVSLSPLALAFVAGYGSDLFFLALDKIVQAFSGGSGASNVVVRETRSGGVVTTAIEGKVTAVSNQPERAARADATGELDTKVVRLEPQEGGGANKPASDVLDKSGAGGRP